MKLGAHIDTNRPHQVHHERVDLRGDAIDCLEIHQFVHDAIDELMPLSRDVQMHARVLVAFQPLLLRRLLFERVVFRRSPWKMYTGLLFPFGRIWGFLTKRVAVALGCIPNGVRR